MAKRSTTKPQSRVQASRQPALEPQGAPDLDACSPIEPDGKPVPGDSTSSSEQVIVEIDKSYRMAIMASRESIEKIAGLIGTAVGPVGIRAECSDGRARVFPTLGSCLSYENPRGATIERLTLTARNDQGTRLARISLGGGWRNVHCNVIGEEEVLDRIGPKLHDQLEGMRQWYGWMHRIQPFYMILAATFFTFMYLFGTQTLREDSDSETTSASEETLAFFLEFGLYFAGILLLCVAYGYVQEQDRLKTMRNWQWVWVSAFLAIPLGVIFKIFNL
jgi:hypothetical protein